MLFALLLGMALNFLTEESVCRPGIEFAARSLLRIGVALLGSASLSSRYRPWAGNLSCWWWALS